MAVGSASESSFGINGIGSPDSLSHPGTSPTIGSLPRESSLSGWLSTACRIPHGWPMYTSQGKTNGSYATTLVSQKKAQWAVLKGCTDLGSIMKAFVAKACVEANELGLGLFMMLRYCANCRESAAVCSWTDVWRQDQFRPDESKPWSKWRWLRGNVCGQPKFSPGKAEHRLYSVLRRSLGGMNAQRKIGESNEDIASANDSVPVATDCWYPWPLWVSVEMQVGTERAVGSRFCNRRHTKLARRLCRSMTTAWAGLCLGVLQ